MYNQTIEFYWVHRLLIQSSVVFVSNSFLTNVDSYSYCELGSLTFILLEANTFIVLKNIYPFNSYKITNHKDAKYE